MDRTPAVQSTKRSPVTLVIFFSFLSVMEISELVVIELYLVATNLNSGIGFAFHIVVCIQLAFPGSPAYDGVSRIGIRPRTAAKKGMDWMVWAIATCMVGTLDKPSFGFCSRPLPCGGSRGDPTDYQCKIKIKGDRLPVNKVEGIVAVKEIDNVPSRV